MIPLDRFSERFAASGGTGARTARNALGVHDLDAWTLFLRETLQNSWDARRSSVGPITFSVTAWTATPGQRSFLRDYVLTEPPPLLGIDKALEDDQLHFLVVSDGGTWGLSGPTRADVDLSAVPGGRSDFVDFVRDIGRRLDKGYGGGTYGFGKAVLSEASDVSTVVIYTRTPMSGKDGSRFIAMAVGNNEYHDRGVRYTGRHWWGRVSGQLAEPLLGSDADTAAFRLGMHNLIRGHTGTAILVVAPKKPKTDSVHPLQEVTSAIADAAAEYAWPHMLPGQQPSIDLQITCEGAPIPVRSPATDPRLRMFAEAFTRCQQLATGVQQPGDPWPWHQRILRSARPDKVLGTLAWRQSGTPGSRAPGAVPRSEIALIRNPHFVVTYRDVPDDLAGRDTFGVFLANPELDVEYAQSEPAAHDKWTPRSGLYFDPARRVLDQIKHEVKERPAGGGPVGPSEEAAGLVSVASALGMLLDGKTAIGNSNILWTRPEPTRGGGQPGVPYPPQNPLPPTSGGGQPPPQPIPALGPSGGPGQPGSYVPTDGPEPTGGQSSPTDDVPGETPKPQRRLRPPVARMSGQPQLIMYGSTVAAEFPFTLSVSRGIESVTLSGQPNVFIDGGKETEPPVGAVQPTVLAWRDFETGTITPGPMLTLAMPGSRNLSVIVSQLTGAAVGVDVVVENYG